MTLNKQLVIVGGGPAGLAAAIAAKNNGVSDIIILEREDNLGGILNQCIHNGFGLHTFKEELTGPEYAQRFIDKVKSENIEYKLGATVLSVTKDKTVSYVSINDGLVNINAQAVILACGCRERPRGAINISGSRCAGIFSAGTAQKLVNIDGLMPGKSVVILGSGDIGLIMARRMTFIGATVKAVIELMPYSSGLNRNIVQCLSDFNIPLYFNHTVVKINGQSGRVESVVIAQVDADLNPIPQTYRTITCDTLLTSVGLIPENELARLAQIEISNVTSGAIVDDNFMTNDEGIFECGNVLHVHDLVDYVSIESENAGKAAADYIKNGKPQGQTIEVTTFNGVRYTVPQKINKEGVDPLTLRMRVDNVYKKVKLVIKKDGEVIFSKMRPIVTPGEMETLTLPLNISQIIRNSNGIFVGLEAN